MKTVVDLDGFSSVRQLKLCVFTDHVDTRSVYYCLWLRCKDLQICPVLETDSCSDRSI